MSHGFAIAGEKLQAARRDLEAMGLYERCRDALARAEELVKFGPEHDEETEMLILNANRALMAASGTHEEMSKKLCEKPDATLDDFKPDPDAWEQEDRLGKRSAAGEAVTARASPSAGRNLGPSFKPQCVQVLRALSR